jgi:hypothetical protein
MAAGGFGGGFADMSDGQPSFYGPEARSVLRHRMKKTLCRYRAKLTITIISIRIEGPLAFDWDGTHSGWSRKKEAVHCLREPDTSRSGKKMTANGK